MSSSVPSGSFDDILDFLETECGFQASSYEESYLKRRIKARLRRTDPTSYEEYHDLLAESMDERERLVDALSINVTKFFRNPEVWTALRPYLRELSARDGANRWWSAACADGREPYSMAMLAIDDDAIDDTEIDIVATDIDKAALADAQTGVYREMRTANIEDQLSHLSSIDPYMDHRDKSYVINPDVKSLVEFHHHDLVQGDPLGPFDLVMCRNLLIYIEAEAKRAILSTLIDSLEPGGYLVIGMSETIPRDLFDGLEPADRSNRIYRKC